MALEKIKPSVVDSTQDFVFGNATVTGNLTTSNANLGNLATANYVTGTLTTANQPNVTSLGTLGNLAVSSNITAGNIKTDYLLYANGSPWAMGTTTTVSGSNTQVQFNDSGSFAASANLTFDKTSNTLSVTNIVANGSGLSSITGGNVTGQVGNAVVAGTVYTAAQPNITSIGALSSLSVTGNITSGNADLGNTATANYFIGNGSSLISLTGANVIGQVTYAATANAVDGANVTGQVTYAATANAVAAANIFGQVANSLVASTVYTNAQPNITSVGTLTSLSVTGNISGANISATSTTASTSKTTGALTVAGGLGVAGDLYAGNSITVDGGAYGNVVTTQFAGVFATANGPNPYSIMQVRSNDGTTGLGMQVYAGLPGLFYSSGNIVFQTGATVRDKDYPTSGTTRTTIDTTGLSVTGNITSTNANLGNAVTANYFIGDGSLLTGISSGSSYTDSNVAAYLPTYTGNLTAGNANLGNNVSANYFTGSGAFLTSITAVTASSVTSNAQANITSLGTLTSLTVGNATSNTVFGNGTITSSGNISFTGENVSLGDVSNVKITGGTSGYFITTDGSGNLSWGAAAGGGGVSATGSNTQIQFNDGGALGASANLVFDKTTNTFTTGRIVTLNGANLSSNVSNVYIGGGSNNQILKTDGAGNLSWIAQPVATIAVDNFTGDGTTTGFTLSVTPGSINQTVVNYNGVFQLREAYTLSGSTLTFSEAPITGSKIEVTSTLGAMTGAGSFVTRNYTGNGIQTTFSVTTGSTVSSVLVTENGLLQTPTVDYTISGSTLTFNAAPNNGMTIQIRELAIAIVSASTAFAVQDEGSNLTTTASLLNFVGAGVTASNDGSNVTVTIPSGGTSAAKALGYSLVFGG